MDRLQIRELEYVVALAEELSFTRAADRLGIAQPPLSRAIGRLERRLGAQLFQRTSRSVTLTSAGKVFAEEARSILAAVDALTRDVQTSRELTVAVRPATGSGLLAAIIDHCVSLSEPLQVDVRFTSSPATEVREGRADVALLCSTHDTAGLLTEALTEQPTVALLSLSHASARRTALTVDDLQAMPGFLRDCPDTGLDEIVDTVALRGACILVSRDVIDRVGDRVAIRTVVDAPTTTLGLAWLPERRRPDLDAFITAARRTAYDCLSCADDVDAAGEQAQGNAVVLPAVEGPRRTAMAIGDA